MLGKTHIALGMLASTFIVKSTTIESFSIVIGASIVGSLLPDIDCENAILRKTIRGESKVSYRLIAIAIVIGFIYEYYNLCSIKTHVALFFL